MLRKALFLDRDGVIIADKGYVHRIEDMEILPGIVDVIREYRASGHMIIIVTNQSGIGRGIFTRGQYFEFMTVLLRRLRDAGAAVDKAYHCPHTPDDGCDCRKPKPGLILRAASYSQIDLKQSTLIGDKDSDIKAGMYAGVGNLILWQQSPR